MNFDFLTGLFGGTNGGLGMMSPTLGNIQKGAQMAGPAVSFGGLSGGPQMGSLPGEGFDPFLGQFMPQSPFPQIAPGFTGEVTVPGMPTTQGGQPNFFPSMDRVPDIMGQARMEQALSGARNLAPSFGRDEEQTRQMAPGGGIRQMQPGGAPQFLPMAGLRRR